MNFKMFLTTLFVGSFVASCSNDDDSNNENKNSESAVVHLAQDIPADKTTAFYSLTDNAVTMDSNSTNWHIAFNATNIYLNGGSSGPGSVEGQVISAIFDELTEAPENGYIADTKDMPAISAAADNAWYIYNDATASPPFAILMAPGRVIVLRIDENTYAKIEVLSYYKGNPDVNSEEFANLQTRPEARFYTFRYAISNGKSF